MVRRLFPLVESTNSMEHLCMMLVIYTPVGPAVGMYMYSAVHAALRERGMDGEGDGQSEEECGSCWKTGVGNRPLCRRKWNGNVSLLSKRTDEATNQQGLYQAHHMIPLYRFFFFLILFRPNDGLTACRSLLGARRTTIAGLLCTHWSSCCGALFSRSTGKGRVPSGRGASFVSVLAEFVAVYVGRSVHALSMCAIRITKAARRGGPLCVDN